MKYILIVPDGMADEPVDELDGLTPMTAAKTPHMDALARRGQVGRVRTIPPGLAPGSDVAALSIMGYDPVRFYTGRAPLEAANQGIDLGPTDVAFRCNLITTDGERIVDYSAGEITSAEGAELIQLIDAKLGTPRIRFYPGISYRNLMVWAGGSTDVGTTPPHDVMGQPLAPHLPQGDHEEQLRQMIWDSYALLQNHPINRRRIKEGKNPANTIWLWGQGHAPRLEELRRRARHHRHGDLRGGLDPRHRTVGRAAGAGGGRRHRPARYQLAGEGRPHARRWRRATS